MDWEMGAEGEDGVIPSSDEYSDKEEDMENVVGAGD